jgi:hypothetical protein
MNQTHLIQIDDRLPELILQLVEISHSDLSKVTRMVFVKIRTVVMLSSCHTTSTRMLAMFSYTAVAGGDVAAAVRVLLAERWALRVGEVALKKSNGMNWM